jgi:hypothetical protein
MNRIQGTIVTGHRHPACVAGALRPDNLSSMRTTCQEGCVVSVIESEYLRSVIASVDDYLMNLDIAEEICSCVLG